jgi:hypothetical protein
MDARSRVVATPLRRLIFTLVLFGLTCRLAEESGRCATYRTRNFVVQAESAAAARKIAEHAETCRSAIAIAWLEKELPPWKTPCPVRVKLTQGDAGGATSFGFGAKGVNDQEMTLEGRLDRILASALPHEITHTIFAEHLGKPMPRWADEGASLLSEDLLELKRHDKIVQDLLTRRGDYTLSKLFQVEEYPRDLMGFYGQGYSVSRFLVEIGGRPRFLAFIRDGMNKNWDESTRVHYGFSGVKELDRGWRAWHDVVVADPNHSKLQTSPLVVRFSPRRGDRIDDSQSDQDRSADEESTRVAARSDD